MHHLVCVCVWIITAWQCTLFEVTVEEGLRIALYPVQWMRLVMMHYGMKLKRMGM